jgi:hypothetical protein
MEEKDRRELGVDRTQQLQAGLRRCRERSFVGEDRALAAGIQPDAGNEPATRPPDSVRADELLLEAPDRGPVLPDERAFGQPGSVAPRGERRLVGTDQTDDVVRVRPDIPFELG